MFHFAPFAIPPHEAEGRRVEDTFIQPIQDNNTSFGENAKRAPWLPWGKVALCATWVFQPQSFLPKRESNHQICNWNVYGSGSRLAGRT
jgi:hypothetical protein